MQKKTSISKSKRKEAPSLSESLRSISDLSLSEALFKAFNDLDYDRNSDVLYGALRGFKSGYGVEQENSIILRYDWEGNFTGATLLDASKSLDDDFLDTL